MSSITLSRNGTSVTITDALAVERSVGRPAARVTPTNNDRGNYIDPAKPASDVFEISGELTTGTPAQTAATLQEDILLPPLGSGNALTLAFDSGLYGYSSDFDVFPVTAAQAARVSYVAGQTGQVRVDTLELQVVDLS